MRIRVTLSRRRKTIEPTQTDKPEILDLFIIGGGVNGCGIARDAAGRGLSVALAEMGDLASATSSASTKLFHGGLRYLEYLEIGLVRKALSEREVLLKAMPHISWPMRFVLPIYRDMRYESDTPVARLLGWTMPWLRGRRPGWIIRIGLFLYDHLGGREILPGTRQIDLIRDPVGAPLRDDLTMAYEYSDCWVNDARLVVLNARDAQARGARIMTSTRVIAAERQGDIWEVTTRDRRSGQTRTFRARILVNAGGPWVGDLVTNTIGTTSTEHVRLVRGSHIVTRKLFKHDKAYFFQGDDGRIIFAIPYEDDFTLIGTTDLDHADLSEKPVCTPRESDYLRKRASAYFKRAIDADDVVWSYSGVRPLYDDGASSASAATRDYVLTLDQAEGAPLLNVFGGKITTYRKLAEAVMAKLTPYTQGASGNWTAGVPMPGGDFPHDGFDALVERVHGRYPFLDPIWARRLVRAYGTEAADMLGDATSTDDLGQDFGATLTEREVAWLIAHEFARTAEDVVWRRGKLGLRMNADQIAALDNWMQAHQA